MGKKSKKGKSGGGKGKRGSGKGKSNRPAPKQHQAADLPPSDTTELDNVGATTEEPPVLDVTADGQHKKEHDAETSETGLPEGLEECLPLFTAAQQELIRALCSAELGQSHLFENWRRGSSDDEKRKLVEQLESMDREYPSGGLAGYVANAKDLLEKSRKGVNPLQGWKPSVPDGQTFDIGTKEYDDVERLGIEDLGRVGFVLVAGGLGERLGYSDIKIGLPTEMTTETKYIQYYIEYILALQKKYSKPGTRLPLCIMTSGDTNPGTTKLLADNNYFGMEKSQITIVQQGQGVPALSDNNAKIALDPESPYRVLAKPHGHGDIHALLYSHDVAKKWLEKGIDWLVLFQDTNGLAFHTLPLTIGVSKKFDLVMNSLAVPRKAKQAVGGIAKLENQETKETRTVNVEYNQLDPLLRSTGFPEGDVNDPQTGFSPYPGNINQLLFHLKPYAATLERTRGVMPEFVNPKYKDAEKTVFKKPTRLECMMQDFPTVLSGDMSKRVGFTSIGADVCFSPVKNATKDGVALQAKGTQPGTAASGEADQYGAIRKIMQSIGCQIDEAQPETYSGITVVGGPAIVPKFSFCSCPGDYKEKFPSPADVKVSSRSTLVIRGSGVTVESLDLDGALVVEAEEGANGVIRNLVVRNAGYQRVKDESSTNEIIAMRGYRVEKKEVKTITFKKDGSIEGYCSPKSPEKEPATSRSVPEKKAAPVKEEVFDEPIAGAAIRGVSLSEPSPEEADESQARDCGCVIL